MLPSNLSTDFPISLAEASGTYADFHSDSLNIDMDWSCIATDTIDGSQPPNSPSTSSESSIHPDDSPSPGKLSTDRGPTVTPASEFPCRFPGCNRVCLRKHTRKKHEEAHSSRAPLSCSEPGCGTTFSRPHDKLRHEVRTHGYPSHTCSKCNSFFAHAKSLGKHKCKSREFENRT
ncbi:hypothetical protein DFH06DRAFT_1246357 [Mycena polygramma]|nr:hypothetical protein DFH06DRAFT_1246357 [Mycena polygramma]